MRIIGQLGEVLPTETSMSMITIHCGPFYAQRKRILATRTLANLAITRHNESIAFMPQLDLEFEVDGMTLIDVNLVV